jgi:signal peptidase II
MKLFGFFAWTIGLLLVDQLSKYLARDALVVGQSKVVIPHVLEVTLVYNTGVAFGLFENLGVFLTPVAIAVAIAAAWSFARSDPRDRLYRAAMILVASGAVGNLIDRLMNEGKVTDFINIYVIHVFNVADMCITFAVLLLLGHMLTESRRDAGATATSTGDDAS